MDADPHAPREHLEHRRIRHARRQSPEQVQPRLAAAHFHFAEMPPQRPDQTVAALLIANLHAGEMRAIAAAAHHFGQRGLLEPGIAVVEQRLRSADGLGDARRRGDEAEPQPGPERLREGAEIDRAVRRRRRDRRQRRSVIAKIAVVIVFEQIAAVASRPLDEARLCGGRRGRIRSDIGARASDRAVPAGRSGNASVCKPSSSTGTPTTRAPAAWNA